jgi:exodeoxyribonuclease VII small subunit
VARPVVNFGSARRFDRFRSRVYRCGATAQGVMTNKNLGKLEQSLEDLEALVERLESGELSLEEALKEFERGIKLTRACQTALKEAEQKVEILLKNAPDAEPVEFEPATDD